MKHNLKNRPKLDYRKFIGYGMLNEYKGIKRWFEGFETEIQEEVKRCEKAHLIAYALGRYETLKEILGE